MTAGRRPRRDLDRGKHDIPSLRPLSRARWKVHAPDAGLCTTPSPSSFLRDSRRKREPWIKRDDLNAPVSAAAATKVRAARGSCSGTFGRVTTDPHSRWGQGRRMFSQSRAPCLPPRRQNNRGPVAARHENAVAYAVFARGSAEAPRVTAEIARIAPFRRLGMRSGYLRTDSRRAFSFPIGRRILPLGSTPRPRERLSPSSPGEIRSGVPPLARGGSCSARDRWTMAGSRLWSGHPRAGHPRHRGAHRSAGLLGIARESGPQHRDDTARLIASITGKPIPRSSPLVLKSPTIRMETPTAPSGGRHRGGGNLRTHVRHQARRHVQRQGIRRRSQ